MIADRQLLTAILAFKHHMIDEPQLNAAIQARLADDAQPMAAYLVSLGYLTHTQRAVLEALVEDQLAEHGRDIGKTMTKAMDGLPEELSKTLASRAAGKRDTHASDDNQTQPNPDRPDLASTIEYQGGERELIGGRYQIIRKLVQSMAVVWVAEDKELNREVALKEIAEEDDNPTARERFLREVEITARLDHPSLVPVFGAGTRRNGRPYYVMRLLPGQTLTMAIREFHDRPTAAGDAAQHDLAFRELLGHFQDICLAIDHAHARGVLHRDIKPSNIFVGKFGESVILDFGLAKLTDRPDPSSPEKTLKVQVSSGSGDLTVRGSVMGTPAYMSPEQAWDPDKTRLTSDIYSLGATLYQLLTGKPPFQIPRDRPQDEANVFQLLEDVKNGRLDRPGTVKPGLDPALEAICLQAMALKPEDRYPTARSLADDIERWLADEPVAAYPEPTARKIGRWVRRHAAVVTGLTAILSTALLALVGTVILVSQARQETEREAARARLGLDTAETAVKELLDNVARNKLVDVPDGTAMRAELQERAVALYHDLLALEPTNPTKILRSASYRAELARLHGQTEELKESQNEYKQLIKFLEDLVSKGIADLKTRRLLADAQNQLAEQIRSHGGSRKDCEPHYMEAIGIAGKLRFMDSDDPETQKLVATTHMDYASMLIEAGSPQEAEPLANQAVDAARVHRRSVPENPKDEDQRSLIILPMTQTNLADAKSRLGKYQAALDVLDETVQEFHRLLEQYPKSLDLQSQIAEALRVQARTIVAENPTRRSQALATLDEAIAKTTLLVNENKNWPYIKTLLTHLKLDRAQERLNAGLEPEANEDLNAVGESLADQVTADSEDIEELQQYARLKSLLALSAAKTGDKQTARSLIEQAIGIQQRAAQLDTLSPQPKKVLEDYKALEQQLGEGKDIPKLTLKRV